MHNVILSGVQQSESVIHICMYTLFLDSFAIGHCRVLSRVPCVTDQSRSCVQLSVTPWTIARQTLLSFSISQSLLKFMSVESVMLPNHLILCRHLLLQSFPASGSLPVSQLFASGGQSIGASASATVLPMSIQG